MSKWDVYSFDEVIFDDTKNGTKIKKEDYLEQGLYPIIDQGQNQIAGYSNNDDGLYDNIPAIVFGDHTRVFKYVNTPFFLGADGVKLLKSKKDKVIYKYLYYFFLNNEVPDTGYNRHFKWIKRFEIPLPSLEIQKKIAYVLDKAQELIDKRKKQIELLDEFLQSVFIDIFADPIINPKGWAKKGIIDCCDYKDDIKCGPFGTQLNKSEFQRNGVPLWGIAQINSQFRKRPVDFLTSEKAKELSDYSIKENDIVMSRKGTVGKCALFPKGLPNGVMHSDVLRIRTTKSIVNPTFICFQLRISKEIERQIAMVSQGAIMAGINVGKLKSIEVLVPPLGIQNQFASIAEATEKQRAMMLQSLTEMENNFNSIMQKAFRGELFK
jgi:Restriction endonuclease S subunits